MSGTALIQLGGLRQKGLTGYCFKYIDRLICLPTVFFAMNYITQNMHGVKTLQNDRSLY